MWDKACSASGRVRANTVTQSIVAQAGTTPAVGTRPRVGLRPTMPLKAAGTRPEPAVSVPRAKSTMPRATATAEPELEPPLTLAGSYALRTAPCGERGRPGPRATRSGFWGPGRPGPP